MTSSTWLLDRMANMWLVVARNHSKHLWAPPSFLLKSMAHGLVHWLIDSVNADPPCPPWPFTATMHACILQYMQNKKTKPQIQSKAPDKGNKKLKNMVLRYWPPWSHIACKTHPLNFYIIRACPDEMTGVTSLSTPGTFKNRCHLRRTPTWPKNNSI